jgi:hypothetical protein
VTAHLQVVLNGPSGTDLRVETASAEDVHTGELTCGSTGFFSPTTASMYAAM